MMKFDVNEEDDGMAFKAWAKKHVHLPYHTVQKLLRKKDVKVDNLRIKSDYIMRHGQHVVLYAKTADVSPSPVRMPSEQQMQALRDMVLYEDTQCFVLNKPSGLAVQGGSDIRDSIDFRLDGLAYGAARPKLVHRLDRHTSGILLLAKQREAAAQLTRAFRERTTRKSYWALIVGVPEQPNGTISLPLGKEIHQKYEKMRVVLDADGQQAVTRYRVVASNGDISWVELQPITGRTHQLRVHMQAIGHSIIGDGKYGGRASHPDKRLADILHLHSRRLVLQSHRIDVTSPLPDHMQRSWQTLGFALQDDGVSLLELQDDL